MGTNLQQSGRQATSDPQVNGPRRVRKFRVMSKENIELTVSSINQTTSPFLSSLLEDREEKVPTINMPDVSAFTLLSFIKSLYKNDDSVGMNIETVYGMLGMCYGDLQDELEVDYIIKIETPSVDERAQVKEALSESNINNDVEMEERVLNGGEYGGGGENDMNCNVTMFSHEKECYTLRKVVADSNCSKMAKCPLSQREDKTVKLLASTKDSEFFSMKDGKNVYRLNEQPKFVSGKWICYKCGDRFKSLGKVYAHLGTAHDVDVAKYTCNVCVYTCHKKQHLDEHMKSVKHERNTKLYKSGVLKVGENNSVMYHCEACQEKFPLLKLYSDHLS